MSNTILKFLHRGLIKELQEINVSQGALTVYRYDVRGNRENSRIRLINKLRRNYMVGKLISEGETHTTKAYGVLYITKNNKTNEIVFIENRKGTKGFEIDEKKRDLIDKLLGIKE